MTDNTVYESIAITYKDDVPDEESMLKEWEQLLQTLNINIMDEYIKQVDAVCEVVDARIPQVSRNPDMDEIAAALKEARKTKGMPTAIIAKTTKGKGVSFMENAVGWHGKAPNDEEYKIAMEDLEKAGEALCQK